MFLTYLQFQSKIRYWKWVSDNIEFIFTLNIKKTVATFNWGKTGVFSGWRSKASVSVSVSVRLGNRLRLRLRLGIHYDKCHLKGVCSGFRDWAYYTYVWTWRPQPLAVSQSEVQFGDSPLHGTKHDQDLLSPLNSDFVQAVKDWIGRSSVSWLYGWKSSLASIDTVVVHAWNFLKTRWIFISRQVFFTHKFPKKKPTLT